MEPTSIPIELFLSAPTFAFLVWGVRQLTSFVTEIRKNGKPDPSLRLLEKMNENQSSLLAVTMEIAGTQKSIGRVLSRLDEKTDAIRLAQGEIKSGIVHNTQLLINQGTRSKGQD